MNEINELLQQIIILIKNNDIQGYKSMLFLINQVAQSQDKELLDSVLMVLGELFEQKVIQEEQSITNDNKKEDNNQNCCRKEDDENRGKSPTIMVGNREWNPYTQGPIDNAVLSQYEVLVPRTLRNLIRRNLNRRYNANLDCTEGKYRP